MRIVRSIHSNMNDILGVANRIVCGYFNHTKQFEFHASIGCFSEGLPQAQSG